MIWAVFAILAGAIWAISNLIDKFIVSDSVKSVWSAFVVFGITDAVVALPLLVLFPISVTELPWSLLIISNILEFVGLLCYFIALKYESATKVVPIFTFSTAVVAIADAVLLGHTVAPVIYVAIAIITIAGFMLARDPAHGITRNAYVFALMITSATAYGILWVVADAILVDIPAEDYTVITLLFSLAYLPVGVAGLLVTRQQYLLRSAKNIFSRKALLPGVLSSATAIVGTLFYSLALSSGGIPTLVESFSMAQHIAIVLIPFLLWPVLKRFAVEHISRKQLVSKAAYISTMVAAAIIILLQI